MTDRKIPIGWTICSVAAVCGVVWALTYKWPVQTGVGYVGLLLIALAVYAFINVRRFLQARKEVSLRKARLSAVKSAIAEAKVRVGQVSNGLKQPYKSNTVSYLNQRISQLTFEQLQLEAELGRAAK